MPPKTPESAVQESARQSIEALQAVCRRLSEHLEEHGWRYDANPRRELEGAVAEFQVAVESCGAAAGKAMEVVNWGLFEGKKLGKGSIDLSRKGTCVEAVIESPLLKARWEMVLKMLGHAA